MAHKRIRIFAGPNGSGKSTIYRILSHENQINLGVFVNADEIEALLATKGVLELSNYITTFDFEDFCAEYKKSSFFNLSKGELILPYLSYDDTHLLISVKENINSYFAAFIADYLRVAMLDCDKTFTIETVMSHKSKIEYIKKAKNKGYRVYLYFVSTRDPKVNIERVKQRTMLGGHFVPQEKVIKRYFSSLDNLSEALLLSDRAYIFDNSNNSPELYIENNAGNLVILKDEIPLWAHKYIIDKF